MAAAAAALLPAGCAVPPLPRCALPVAGPRVFVVDLGWHTEVALAAADIVGPLHALLAPLPGAQALSFGFGKRSFLLAEAGWFGEYLLGPLPGAGALQVTGLARPPHSAFTAPVTGLPLDGAARARLCAFLWDSFARDAAGLPVPVTPALDRPQRYFAAARGYSLDFTCNSWTAEALRAAGAPIDPAGVVLAGDLRARLAAIGACAAA